MPVLSQRVEVKSGVPQGLVLGPVLFLIYVNHVVSNLQSKYKIFADDLKVYLSVKCDDCESLAQSIQTDINILYETSLSWGLEMNVRKCKCIRFSPINCALPFIGIMYRFYR